jgi:hypothetical protein
VAVQAATIVYATASHHKHRLTMRVVLRIHNATSGLQKSFKLLFLCSFNFTIAILIVYNPVYTGSTTEKDEDRLYGESFNPFDRP